MALVFLKRLGGRYTHFLDNNPIAGNFMTGGVLGFVGDVICQKVVEKNENFDIKRSIGMTTFGTFYSGGISFFIYTRLYPRFIPKSYLATPLKEGISTSAVDNFVHVPFLYTPAFIIWMGVFNGDSLKTTVNSMMNDGTYWTSIYTCWLMWIPVQAVNFGLVPMHLRTPFVNVFNLVWNVIFDYIVANSESEETVTVSESVGTPESVPNFVSTSVLAKRYSSRVEKNNTVMEV